MELNYNIGAGDTNIPGFINLDFGDDVSLENIRPESVNAIYSSHFLEYFDDVHVVEILKSWYNALKEDGELFLSVPDFDKLVDVYKNTGEIMIGPLYGKIESPKGYVYHKTCFNYVILKRYLLACGFKKVERFNPFVDDCSQAPISLNLKCSK